MRIVELEIQNVRGIRHLILKPDAKNLVVWGPNGSGKSAVVDAIDFLLTGRISRLSGRGTGGISLQEHGPHIDHGPEDAVVRAIVQLPGSAEGIEIKRCMADPEMVDCSKSAKTVLQPVLTLAKRGQHVLTRREILKYVTAEAGTRAQEIQELLNIGDIENIRKALVRTCNDLDSAASRAQTAANTARSRVNTTLQQSIYSEDAVLEEVNRNRALLSGPPVSVVKSSDLKSQLTYPSATTTLPTINPVLLAKDVARLRGQLSAENRARTSQRDKELRTTSQALQSDPALRESLYLVRLSELGLGMLDETGRCPLCGFAWTPGELRTRLEERLSKAQVAQQYQDRLQSLSAAMTESIAIAVESLGNVLAAAKADKLASELATLQAWHGNLTDLSLSLSERLEEYWKTSFGPAPVESLLAPTDALPALEAVLSALSANHPEPTPEMTAWDTLTRLEENLKVLETAEASHQLAALCRERGHIILSAFLAARDSVLGTLYEEIRDRFVGLYRQLHHSDDASFGATMEPEGAGLTLEVDFYGRGTHPPHALHSEGHQDTMGLCLYLALAERLNQGVIDLTVLDDVVMSVDAEHRRQVCLVLAKEFPGRQFLITTHDRTWAQQLRSQGIVDSAGAVEFYQWTVDTGPRVNYEADIWLRIEADLEKDEVSSAAARLRRGAEQFLETVCDALRAPLKYRSDGRWELGDYLAGAIGCINRLQKQAKAAAQSWGQTDRFEQLVEYGSVVGQVYARTQAEEWAINASVHYNNWANLGASEFRPVVDAFHDLFELFVCTKCRGLLHVVRAGPQEVSVKCVCANVDWNLTGKEKVKT